MSEMNKEPFPQALVVRGRIIKIGQIQDEFWQWESLPDPVGFIESLRAAKRKCDIFTFSQRLPDTEAHFPFYHEIYSVAAIPISTFDVWWKSQIDSKTRNVIRKAESKGVTVRVVELSDDLVRGITAIYDETPTRQGKPFPHYNRGFEANKAGLITYPVQSTFIGAYLGEELIGFIKLTATATYASTMHILSKVSHREKSPTNALVAHAVKVCEEKKIPFLVYGYWSERGLGDFKKHNGFKKIDLPRYFIPLTLKGKMGLALNMHRGIKNMAPKPVKEFLVRLRSMIYAKKTIPK